jgi:hypothetical protein
LLSPPVTPYAGISPKRPNPKDSSPQVTFVLHDAGETKAMQPVMEALEQERINFTILADSTASKLLQGNFHLIRLPAGVFYPADIVALSKSTPVGGLSSLPHAQAMACLQQLQSSRCVVTGVVSEFQKVWSSFFKQRNQPVIGYYDGFSCNPNDKIAENFMNCLNASSLDALITPSEDTANFFRQRFQELNPQQPNISINALGQPILETTAKAIQTTNPLTLVAHLGIDLGRPTILFVGGYGTHYPEAFRLFCQTMYQFPNTNLLVALHPKVNGALEMQLLAENPTPSPIKIVPRDIDVTQLLALSPIVLSQDSTFITQAVLQGKKAAFIGKPVSSEPGTFNPLLTKNITTRAKNLSSLVGFIQSAITIRFFENNPMALGKLQSDLGIPPQATDRIVGYLKTICAVSKI